VPEPVAFLPERGFVLQEKVPGRQASDLLHNPTRGCFAAADCARWLAALHQSGVPAAPSDIDRAAVSQWARELCDVLPDERDRLDKIARAVAHEGEQPLTDIKPSHGDFHPMNVFIAGTHRITGIDIDKFAAREPEADIGWFLMQTGAFGFFDTGKFRSTEPARRFFIQCYESETGTEVRESRAVFYMAMAFLKNLHFELVLLKTGRTEYANPWLTGAASSILEGDIYLSKNP
jgi:aminoglycoside phosphotransferase (APT) family kinase protein